MGRLNVPSVTRSAVHAIIPCASAPDDRDSLEHMTPAFTGGRKPTGSSVTCFSLSARFCVIITGNKDAATRAAPVSLSHTLCKAR